MLVGWLVWWATDMTPLTWADCDLVGAISHAIALDVRHCCRSNYVDESLVIAPEALLH